MQGFQRKQFNSIAGILDIVDLSTVSKILFDKHAKEIYEHLLNKAIDDIVLTDSLEDIPETEEAEDIVEYSEQQDLFGSASFADDKMFSEYEERESFIRKAARFNTVKVGSVDGVIEWISDQIRSQITIVKKINNGSFAHDIEEISCHALENFHSPTHFVEVKPRVWMAIDPQEIEVKIKEVNGRIKMCIFSPKRTMFDAMEVANELDF